MASKTRKHIRVVHLHVRKLQKAAPPQLAVPRQHPGDMSGFRLSRSSQAGLGFRQPPRRAPILGCFGWIRDGARVVEDDPKPA